MKQFALLLVAVAVLLGSFNSYAQVTNLKVFGFTSNFSFVESSGVNWEFNLPVGASAACEVWIDMNQNGVIDPLVDKSPFGTFTMTDGDIEGQAGPPDMDSLVNGHVLLNLPDYGMAPAKYVLKFTNNGVSASIAGTVTQMPSPAYTISGKVNIPTGATAKIFLVVAEDEMRGAMTLSDINGNYTIRFTNRAAGMIYGVYVNDILPPYVVSPERTHLTMTQSYTGINFTFGPPVAKVTGYLKGENGHIFANERVRSVPRDMGGQYNRTTITDVNGFYQIGYSLSDLTTSPIWELHAEPGNIAPNYVIPGINSLSLHQGDSLRVNLTAFAANDSIKGTVLLDGHAPNNVQFIVDLGSEDSGYVRGSADPVTGKFKLRVSKKIFNYYPWLSDLPDKYGFDHWDIGSLHPGNLSVILKVQTISWLKQLSPVNNKLNCVFAFGANNAWAGGENGTLVAKLGAASSWTVQNSVTNNPINSVYFRNTANGWFAGGSGVIKVTTNGGQSWSAQNSTTALDLKKIQFLDANNGFAAGGAPSMSVFLKTTNGGTSWVNMNFPGFNTITNFQMVSQNIGWVIQQMSLYKTTNGGSSWEQVMPGGGVSFNGLHFTDVNNGWLIGNPAFAMRTTDGGANWTPYYFNHIGQVNAIYSVSSQRAWVCGPYGFIAQTRDGGTTWQRQMTNREQDLLGIAFGDANNGWAVGNDGVILNTTNGGFTAMRDYSPTLTAESYQLSQNYPNPFNPVTTIEYRVPEGGMVDLRIFDVLGREVAMLIYEEQKAGEYKLRWNAAGLPSGTYLYRLQSGVFTQTRKLLLIK